MTDPTDAPARALVDHRVDHRTVAANGFLSEGGIPDAGLTAVILSGGASRRMGRDKASLVLDGASLLERTAAAATAAGARGIVVVGDPPAGTHAGPAVLTGARFVREDPPLSGPVAALEAALCVVDTPWILLVPCDLARPDDACRALVEAARSSVPGVPEAQVSMTSETIGRHGVVAVDATGHRQHLTALLDAAALRAAHRPGITRVRERLALLDLSELPEPADAPGLWDDMDTPEDVARVRAGQGVAVAYDEDPEVPGLREWMTAVVMELGLPEDVIVPTPLLDTARDVAQQVLRPGAPVSTYLIGVALGLQLARDGEPDGGGDAAPDTGQRIHDLAARVQDLAYRYEAPAAGER